MGGSSSRLYKKPKEVADQWYPGYVASMPDLKGKFIAVTGCTSGTGFACCRALAMKGAHVIMLNRQSERATAAEAQLKQDVPGATVTCIACDLQSFDSVKAAANELRMKFGGSGIDVLANNAGVMALEDVATKDGYDVQVYHCALP